MATEVGKLVIDLEARVGRLEKGLRRGQRAIGRFERRATRAFRKVGNAFARLARRFTGIGIAVGGLAAVFGFVQFTRASIKASAEVETFRIRLRSLIGDADEADASLARLTVTATEVAPPLREIIEAAATLGTVALGSSKKIEELTRTALNIQAVTGLTLTQTAQNLQRALSAGIGAADLFRERGIRALLEALTDFSNLVQAPLEDVERAFEEVFGSGGIFGTAAEAFAQTLPGAISRTGDALFNLQTAFGNAISPVVIAFLTEQVIPFFENLTEEIKANEDAIANFVQVGLVRLIRGFLGAATAALNFTKFLIGLRISIPLALGRAALAFSRFFTIVSTGFARTRIGKLLGITPEDARAAADTLGNLGVEFVNFAEQGRLQVSKGTQFVDRLLGRVEKLNQDLNTFGIISRQNASAAQRESRQTLAALQAQLEAAALVDDPRTLREAEAAQGRLNRLIQQAASARLRTGEPLIAETQELRRQQQLLIENEAIVRGRLSRINREIEAQRTITTSAEASAAQQVTAQRRLENLIVIRENEVKLIEEQLLPSEQERIRLLFLRADLEDALKAARSTEAGQLQVLENGLAQLTDEARAKLTLELSALATDLAQEKSIDRRIKLLAQFNERFQETKEIAADLAELGDTIGGVIGSQIKDALLTAIRGGAVDFGMILADTAARLLDKSLDNVLTDLASGLNELFGRAGAQLGSAISSALGFGALLLGGLLQRTEATTQAANVASAITSTQAVRGIVAGPTQIAVAEIGRTIQEAFVETNLILRRMLGVLVDQRTLLAGGAVAASGAGVGGEAGFGADTDEILSTVSASFV